MVRIQLETGYLDVKPDTNFPVNFSIGDIRDLSKRTGAFSKTITLEGTKNNHDLLNQYYDVNVVSGTFDVNALTKCSVIQNGIPVMEDAYLQLVSIVKDQSTMDYEQGVTYEVLVKDAKSSFFTAMGGKELTDLDFSDLSHTYNASNVVSSWSHTEANGYKYPLCWNPIADYTLNEFKPAIYAKTYFDRIFATNGFTYEWSTLSQNRFDKLIIPYNGDTKLIDVEAYRVRATTAQTITYSQPYTGQNISFHSTLVNWTETQDNSNIFNPTTGTLTNAVIVSQGHALNINLTVTYNVKLNNTSGATAYLRNALNQTYRWNPSANKNGIGPINSVYDYTHDISIPNGFNLPNGSSTIGTQTSFLNLPVSYLAIGDLITINGGLQISSDNFNSARWRSANNDTASLVNVDVILEIVSIETNITYSSDTVGAGSTINPTDFVPRKIKQADFMKSIFQMYNLYIDTDRTNTNNLILTTRNDFYDSGDEKDWSNKLAKDKDQTLQFLPEIASKKLIFSYKQDADDPNKIYKEATNEIYGQVEFTFDNEYIKGIEQKDLIFSPTPISQTTFNAIVPLFVGSAPKNNIRILYDGDMLTSAPFNIYDDTVTLTGVTGITSYPAITHFDNPIQPQWDINFGVCDYYFYQLDVLTNNNLYNNYWRRTVNQINTGKMLTAYFDLREVDIQSLKLNDKIYINNSWWNINKVIDYNCNVRMLTKVELISVDNEIDYAPFPSTKPNFIYGNQLHPYVEGLNGTFTNNNNVVADGSNVKVYGIGNVVGPGVTGVVVGNNKTVSTSGVYADNIVSPYPVIYPSYVFNDTWTIGSDQCLLVFDGTVNTTWTLPPLRTTGQQFIIKNIGTGALTLEGDGSDYIDSALNIKLLQWDSVTVVDMGIKWIII
jgi:hypothetical protein